jgi:hypothetical protein|tara:strand:+ start:2971 stop:3780 length:810 start_codon:yes stop_codon:yes gene_type:complete
MRGTRARAAAMKEREDASDDDDDATSESRSRDDDDEEEEESSSESFDDDEFVQDEDEDEAEDEDESQGEDDDDSEEEEDEALARPVSNAMLGMSRAFQSLVGDDEDEDETTAMLPKSRKQRADELEAKAEEKERRAIKRAKLEVKQRGHVKPQPRGRDVESDMLERRLHNTATKGVVRLFKAVGKAQQDAEKAKTMRRKDALISKAKFLEELRGEKKSKHDADEKSTSKASFLHNDFMLDAGKKMKDWDREQSAAPKDLEYDEDEDDVF